MIAGGVRSLFPPSKLPGARAAMTRNRRVSLRTISLYLPRPVHSGIDRCTRVPSSGKRENSEGDVQRF